MIFLYNFLILTQNFNKYPNIETKPINLEKIIILLTIKQRQENKISERIKYDLFQ